jgi:hypothetical protein
MQENRTEKAVAKFSVNKIVTKNHLPCLKVAHSFNRKNKVPPETRTIRDRRPSTAACPACCGMGVKGIEIVYGKEKNILYLAA